MSLLEAIRADQAKQRRTQLEPRWARVARGLIWLPYKVVKWLVLNPTYFASWLVDSPVRERQRAWKFLRAMFGGLNAPAEAEARSATCDGCEHRQQKTTPILRREVSYCGACGCPDWLPAELGVKVHLRLAECSLEKWDETEAEL